MNYIITGIITLIVGTILLNIEYTSFANEDSSKERERKERQERIYHEEIERLRQERELLRHERGEIKRLRHEIEKEIKQTLHKERYLINHKKYTPISYPLTNTVVERSQLIKGTISGFADNKYYFLIIQSHNFGKLYYPQQELFSVRWEKIGIYGCEIKSMVINMILLLLRLLKMKKLNL
jgi:hypothetical protein